MPLGQDPFANFERMRREIDELWARSEAKAGFGRAVYVAREGATYAL